MKTIIYLITLSLPVAAESLRSANVTVAIKDVQVFSGSAASHTATVGEKLSLPSSIQTGRQSRAELTFTDHTLTRLGQNSIFSFREGGRNVELQQGSVLLQVPKNVGGATIRTATVTCAISGTTVMFEYSPKGWIKLITLEGTQKLTINGSNVSMALPAGKMIIMHPDAKVIPQPVDVDIAKLIATSPLAGNGVFAPLPAAAMQLVKGSIEKQTIAKRKGLLTPTNFVVTGPGGRNAKTQTTSIAGDRLTGPLGTQGPGVIP